MSDVSMQAGHPFDELSEYLRGRAADEAAIERHLAGCATCRSELALLRALAASGPAPLSDVERERLQQAVEARRIAAGTRPAGEGVPGAPGTDGAAGPHPWLSWTWRAAAGIAVVLMSIGVLRVVEEGATSDWDPGLALDGWGREISDLALEAGEVRLALGAGILDDPILDVPLEEAAAGLEDLRLPWEEEDP